MKNRVDLLTFTEAKWAKTMVVTFTVIHLIFLAYFYIMGRSLLVSSLEPSLPSVLSFIALGVILPISLISSVVYSWHYLQKKDYINAMRWCLVPTLVCMVCFISIKLGEKNQMYQL